MAEAKRAYELLKREQPEKTMRVAVENFKWKAKAADFWIGENYYQFGLHFTNYVRNIINMRENKWKLVNRALADGYVFLTHEELARLLQEEVYRRILEKISSGTSTVPDGLKARVERVQQLIASRAAAFSVEEVPKMLVAAAMPPCIKNLYDRLFAGKHIPHMGRFTLTSFLINAGASEEEVFRILTALSDFNERVTRYQIEHIAGRRGSKTKYNPPKCTTLKTHGICYMPDQLCKTITHPSMYYKVKLRSIMRKGKVGHVERARGRRQG